MSEQPATFAERIEREVDAFFRLWNTRRFLAVILLLALAGFALYSGYNLYAQHQRIAQLEIDKTNLTNTNNALALENKGLRETVAPLLRQAAKEFPGEEINVSLKKLLDKFDALIPERQTVKTGSATVEIRIKSDKELNNHFMDQGGYIAFGKATDPILIMTSGDCSGRQLGNGMVLFRAVFQLDATSPAIGKPLTVLQDAEFIQIGFLPMDPESTVLDGKAICTFNSAVRMEFTVPAQTMKTNFVLIPEIKTVIEHSLIR
jgi:hypothetical protein